MTEQKGFNPPAATPIVVEEPKLLIHSVTQSTDINTTLNPGVDFDVKGIFLHIYHGPISPTITISRDSVSGSNYDTVLYTEAAVNIEDFVFMPEEGEFKFIAGDGLNITITGISMSAGTAYLTVIYQEK